MVVVTYSHARQNLAELLDIARREGQVMIKRKDGTIFSLKPEKRKKSPLDVKGVQTNISKKEMVDIIRESRERDY